MSEGEAKPVVAKAQQGKTIIRIRQSSAMPLRNPVRVVRTQRLVPQQTSPVAQCPVKVQSVETVPVGGSGSARTSGATSRVAVLSPVDYEEEVTVDVVEALAQRDGQGEAEVGVEAESLVGIDEEELQRAQQQVLAAPAQPARKKAKLQRPYGRFAANTGPQPHLHKYVTYEEFNRQKADIEANTSTSREEKGKERKRIADSFEKQKKTLAARILSEQANQVVDLIAAHPEVLNEQMTQIILNTTANYFKDHYGKDIVEEAERLRNAVHTQPLPGKEQ